MPRILIFIVLLCGTISMQSHAQKKYGYAVLYLRCGKMDPEKNRVYYSPVIELNSLNFKKYTDGMDPAFRVYSVQYFNYAISKWFEIYLKDRYKIAVNDTEKYERDAHSVVLNDKNMGDCNNDKTYPACFFTDKQKVILQRENAIRDSKSTANRNRICEVIAL